MPIYRLSADDVRKLLKELGINMKQIPEHIFKAAQKYDGIPLDFHEDEDALTIVMVDGRKIVEEKESGTRKRIQRAEAEQAEAQAAASEAEHNRAVEAERKANESMNKAKERAEALRAIADAKSAPAAPDNQGSALSRLQTNEKKPPQKGKSG